MNQDENQNIELAVLNEQLKNINEKLQTNSEEHKAILDKIIYIKTDLREKVDSHCVRLRSVEKDLAVFKEEMQPAKNLTDKISSFALGLVIILGTIVLSLVYFLRNKL